MVNNLLIIKINKKKFIIKHILIKCFKFSVVIDLLINLVLNNLDINQTFSPTSKDGNFNLFSSRYFLVSFFLALFLNFLLKVCYLIFLPKLTLD